MKRKKPARKVRIQFNLAGVSTATAGQMERAAAILRSSLLRRPLATKDFREGGILNEPQGKRAVRMPDEPVDDRPVVVITHPFWKDGFHQGLYTEVARAMPMKPGESRFHYIVRLAEAADKEYRAELEKLAAARR